jgi:sugar phosphate isomerase/epimerase
MFSYSYFILVNVGPHYEDEPLERSVERLSNYGYDGVEFVGQPDKVDTKEIRKLLRKYKIMASSVIPIYTSDKDLVSANGSVRRVGIEYVKDCVRMAYEIEAPVVVVAPSACMKVYPQAAPEQEWNWAVTGILEAGEYAASLGINLALEAWNRYETYFLNRLDQAVELAEAINLTNVGVMGDLFHMNIEEVSLAKAILTTRNKLLHIHIADSNRAAPGRGHINFKPVIEALRGIEYQGYLAMELLPAAADPFAAMKVKRCEEFFEQYAREAIDFMKELEAG